MISFRPLFLFSFLRTRFPSRRLGNDAVTQLRDQDFTVMAGKKLNREEGRGGGGGIGRRD